MRERAKGKQSMKMFEGMKERLNVRTDFGLGDIARGRKIDGKRHGRND